MTIPLAVAKDKRSLYST